MIRNDTKNRLQQDIGIWYADGLIDEPTLQILQERYESYRAGWVGVIKYLGITGGLLAFLGIMGLVTAIAGSELFAAAALGGLGCALTWWGLRLAGDLRDRYPTSSKVVMTLGVICWTSAVALLAHAMELRGETAIVMTGLVSLPLGFFLAYRNRNGYLLIVTLLGLFHWIGSWNEMWGRSTYVFSVQDPKVMSLAALGAIGVGLYHERALHPRTGRFYLAWETVGLVYLNMSLLILSIWGYHDEESLGWILVFTAATIAQIVLGAAWQNGLLRGFGITFFVINVFTRYHETFWDQLDLGRYLLAGGALLLVIGAVTEFAVRRVRAGRAGA